MSTTRRTFTRLAALGIAASALALTGCSAGGSEGGATPSAGYTPGSITKAYKGTTISVMMPPWGSFQKSALADFEERTGITVNLQTLDWDAIHDKVVTTSAAGQAPADVVEMDWTWVSQFGAAGWFAPLDPYISKAQLADLVGADTFVKDGQRLGVPYNLDFRGTELNMTMLKKAGVTTAPKTIADVLAAAEAVKKAGVVQYPIGVPLKVVESTSTPWYALTRASGGQILTTKGEPAFTDGSAAKDVLAFYREAYQKGLIDPGAIGQEDVAVTADFTAGKSAILLAAGPGQNATFVDKAKSKIASDELLFIHTPGTTGDTGATIGLQEGLAIPKASKNKEAAATFISWWLETPQLITSYKDPNMGNLPPSKAALEELASKKELAQADTILGLVGTVQPVVPGGTPTWYSKFSAEVASTIQNVALGKQTPDAGLTALGAQTKQLASQGN